VLLVLLVPLVLLVTFPAPVGALVSSAGAVPFLTLEALAGVFGGLAAFEALAGAWVELVLFVPLVTP